MIMEQPQDPRSSLRNPKKPPSANAPYQHPPQAPVQAAAEAELTLPRLRSGMGAETGCGQGPRASLGSMTI